MIEVVSQERHPLPDFAPVVAEWMRRRFAAPTEAQQLAWPVIAEGRNTLVFSPTGSGKTLAAFLWAIHELVELSAREALPTKPYIVYVSPLRALANDVEKNLLAPLQEMRELSEELGLPFPEIRVAVRTGDTPPRERQRMRRRPPHILITTPESLYLLLTSGFRENLDEVRYAIVDEIHYLSGDKRGAHLAITLERLEALIAEGSDTQPDAAPVEEALLAVAGRWRSVREQVLSGAVPAPAAALPSRPPRRLTRIGLSATQSPVEEIARYLVGCGDDGAERDCAVVDLGVRRDLDLRIITPVPNLVEAKTEQVLDAIYEQLFELVSTHRTTLIFCNSRYWTERVAAELNKRAEERNADLRIGAHHGSMSRAFRLEMEDGLKTGALRAVVATSSLELGIDIGHLDLVCQVESPKSVAAGLQRVGRAGHLLGLTSKGRLFPISRDDLVEMAVLTHAMLAGDLEPVHIPRNCLDVVAQQVAAMAAIDDGDPEAMLRLLRRAYSFRDLRAEDFTLILEQLSGRFAGQELYEARARIDWDRAQNHISGSRGALTVAQQNAGTIPEYAEYTVHAEDYDRKLGTLDEAFVQRLRPGQTFVLGTRTWEHRRVDRSRIYVRDSRGRAPTVPYWLGPDVIPRSFALGEQIARFRSVLFARLFEDPDELRRWLMEEYCLDELGAQQIIEYFVEQAHSLDTWPGRDTLVVETSRNPLGHLQLLLHSPYGARLNEAWAEALAQAAREEMGIELQGSYSDDALVLHLPPGAERSAAEILSGVTPENLLARTEAYVRESALFAIRFRHAAVRALAVLRMSRGKKRPVWLQEAAARRLEREVEPLRAFPVVTETVRECLEDYLDLGGLRRVLEEIASGAIRLVSAEVEVPSPFGHGLLLAGQFGAVHEAARRERRAELLSLHRDVLRQILDEDSIRDLLDPKVVAEFEARRQGTHESSRARDPEELLRLLRRCGELSEDAESALFLGRHAPGEWREWLRSLWHGRRAVPVVLPTAADDARRWIAAEDYWLYADAFGRQLKEDHRHTRLLDALRAAGEASTLDLEVVGGEEAALLLQDLEEAYRVVRSGEEAGETLWALPEERLEAARPTKLSRIVARRQVLLNVLRGWGPVAVLDLARRYGLSEKLILGALSLPLETGEVQQGDFVTGRAAPQVCTRANLEELHRLALATLRRTLEPVSLERYVDFLLKWQHLHPKTRRQGSPALTQLVDQFAGCRAYPRVWERDFLGLRLDGAEPREVGVGVFLGETLVGQFSLGEEKPRPLLAATTFVPRARAAELLEVPSTESRSAEELAVLRLLREHGEQPLDGIKTATGLTGEELERVLWRLFRAGLVGNTDYSAIARCAWTGSPRWEREVLGPADLAAEEPAEDEADDHSADAQEAALEAAADLRQAGLRSEQGRWYWIGSVAAGGPSDAEVGRRCRARVLALMSRYGVAAREVLLAKSGLPPRDVSRGLRELFLRGQLLRGFFVKTLSGDQFALPEALEFLRSHEPAESEPGVMLGSLDPAAIHLSVVKVGGMQNRPLAGRYLVLVHGELAAVVDTHSSEGRFFRVRDITILRPESDDPLRRSTRQKQVALAVVDYAVRWGQWEAVRVGRLEGEPVATSVRAVPDFLSVGYSLRHGLLSYRLRKRVAAVEPERRLVRPSEAKQEDLHPTSKPVLDFYNYVITRYVPPPDKDLLVFFQCSVSRPYSKSPSHASMRQAIRLATGHDPRDDSDDCRCHVVVLSSVIGPVPYELEDVYPATERGGGVKHMSPEEYRVAKPILAERLAAYLRRWHHQYRVITTFTHDRYADVMEAAKRLARVDFAVLPDTRGPRLRGGNQYWTKYWIQVFFELLKGMTDEEQEAARERLRASGVEVDEHSLPRP